MDVITAIRRERGKFYVTVNGDEKVVVPAPLFRERPLSEGETIDLEEYDHWLMVRQYRAALDRAVAFLASRARSRREVEARLHQAGYRPCTVEMVLYKLERERLLDDGDFARQWVEARAGRKLGKNRIARELRDKGVSAEEAEAALTALDEDDQLDAAVQLAEKTPPPLEARRAARQDRSARRRPCSCGAATATTSPGRRSRRRPPPWRRSAAQRNTKRTT